MEKPAKNSLEDTQQFSAAEVAQLKRYAKRSAPIQPKPPTTTNRVHLAIVIAVGLVAIAILGLIAWYLYLAVPQNESSDNSLQSRIVTTRLEVTASTARSAEAFEGAEGAGILRTAATTSHR